MKHTFLACLTILAAAAIGSAQTTFYYPHVVNGVLGGTVWKTTILLTNPAPNGTAPASGSVTLTKDDSVNRSAPGTPLVLSFTDETGAAVGSGNVISFLIPGGQTKKFTSSGTGVFSGGFAAVASTNALAGTAIFSEFDTAGHLITEAGVPAAQAVTRQAIFVDTQQGYNIGVAYANPGTTIANVTLQLLNANAALVSTTTTQLGPGNHDARFTFQLFSPAPAALTGTMVIESQSPLAAVALRTDPTFSLYTTLPPVTLASIFRPALEWIQQRPWMSPFTSIARLMSNLPLRMG